MSGRKIEPRRIVGTGSPSMKRILAALEEHGPMNGRAIADKACLAFNTFQNCYRHLLQSEGLIHQSGWQHNHRGPFVPVYAFGPAGELVIPRRPKKIDQLERARNWKQRTGYNEARKAERRLRRPPDRALAALLGIAS